MTNETARLNRHQVVEKEPRLEMYQIFKQSEPEGKAGAFPACFNWQILVLYLYHSNKRCPVCETPQKGNAAERSQNAIATWEMQTATIVLISGVQALLPQTLADLNSRLVHEYQKPLVT